MSDFKPYDLGTVLRNVEGIRALRARTAMAPYEQELLQLQTQTTRDANTRAAAEEARRAELFAQEQQVSKLRLLNAAAAEIGANPQSQARWLPQLKAGGIPDEVLAQPMDAATAKQIIDSTGAALRAFQQTGTNRRVQSSKVLENGNLGNVYTDGTVEDTGVRAAPTQGVRAVKLQLPDGRTVDAFLDPTDGSLRGADGAVLSQPSRGPGGGGAGQPTGAPDGLGMGRPAEDETRAKELAEADAADLVNAPKRLKAASEVIAQIDTNIDPVFEKVLQNASAWNTGLLSKVQPAGSPAADLAANLSTITADTAFNTLQQMREASPTGGALGAVTERELDLLAARKRSLLQSQSPDQFRENVTALRADYARIRSLAAEAKQADLIKTQILQLGRRQQTPETQQRLQAAQQRLYAIEDSWMDRAGQEQAGPAPAPGGGGGGPPRIRDDADFDALPSGTEFIDPEGRRRRKP